MISILLLLLIVHPKENRLIVLDCFPLEIRDIVLILFLLGKGNLLIFPIEFLIFPIESLIFPKHFPNHKNSIQLIIDLL